MIAGWIALGGFFGAITRYILITVIKKLFHTDFPVGTILVNMIGSFMLGYFIAMKLPSKESAMLGTGFLGAFTTFSTFNLELVQLLDEKKTWTFWSYLGFSYSLGILFAFLGYISK